MTLEGVPSARFFTHRASRLAVAKDSIVSNKSSLDSRKGRRLFSRLARPIGTNVAGSCSDPISRRKSCFLSGWNLIFFVLILGVLEESCLERRGKESFSLDAMY